MPLYAQVDNNNQVISVNQLAGTENQSNLISITQTEYDGMIQANFSLNEFPAKAVNGSLQGLYSELSYNSTSKTVTATIYDYEGNLQTGYANPVTFSYDGTTSSATPSNGVATIGYTSNVSGAHVITTTNADLYNGKITITL